MTVCVEYASFFCTNRMKKQAMVRMLSPPISMRTAMTVCPKMLSVVPTSATDSPVTQMEEVAKNRASTKLTLLPGMCATGRQSKPAPMRIGARKQTMMMI